MKKIILFSVAAFGLATIAVSGHKHVSNFNPVIGDAEVLEDIAGRVCRKRMLPVLIPFF